MAIDYERLWRHVIGQCPRPFRSIHGPLHWYRVERSGVLLARITGADLDVVRLFAVFHDSRRQNEGLDPEHGRRGAELAAALRGVLYDLAEDRFQLLREACTDHTAGVRHPEPTIGTCWDSDRLDLPRVGQIPAPAFMSTEMGRHMAEMVRPSTAAVLASRSRYPAAVTKLYRYVAGFGSRRTAAPGSPRVTGGQR